MTDSASVLAPGIVIADTYEVERQLGRGGMGEVWLAKHRRLAGKLVAIKVLRTGGQLPAEALARFRHEAEIAARLEHPNIVQVLDFNTLPTGEPFLAMELLKGESLAHRLLAGPLSLEAVVNVVRQAGAALQAAHAGGVVHRDLKPDNIFLVPTAVGDQVKVLDFGISKLADSNTVQTTDSVLIGTPLYMSPEQALGLNRDITPQSDVFSMASICYELLTGEAPFRADNVARVVFRIAYEAHHPLSELRPDLPPSVVNAIEHALQKDKAHRTADIATFVFELTGQALGATAPLVRESQGGMYSPSVPVSESLLSGATVARPGTAPRLATQSQGAPPARAAGAGGAPPQPPVGAPPPSEPATPPTGSSRTVALVVGAVVILGVTGAVGWQMTHPPVTESVDAGAPLALPPAPSAPDAGPVVAVPPPVDAGTEPPAEDAGQAEKPPPVRHVRVDPTGSTPAEDKVLRGLREQAKAEQWGSIVNQRNRVAAQLRTPGAHFEGLMLVITAACAERQDTLLRPLIVEFRSLASPDTFRRERKRCLERYPEANVKWE